MVVLIIAGGVVLFTSIVSFAITDESDLWGLKLFAAYLGMLLLLLGVSIMSIDEGYDKGQIDALKGIQTHEIQYVFPQGDTIPCDTLYVKIK